MKALVAIDESSTSRAAVDALLGLQLDEGTSVTLLTVLQPEPPLSTGMKRWEAIREHLKQRRQNAKEFLENEGQPYRDAGLDVRIAVDEGHAAEKILSDAQDVEADLIVVGSHGRGALSRLVLGGASHKIVLHADCSVLVAREKETRKDGPLRVLATFDDSESAWAAMRMAAGLRWREPAQISVMRVHQPIEYSAMEFPSHEPEIEAEEKASRAALTNALAVFQDAGAQATPMFQVGHHPHREILAAAKELDADLIVVGDKGQSAISRFLVGSVTHRVVNEAHCSVLVVRP